jgi:hypothetical protein
MRFVLVCGRMPFSQTHCASCNQPISARYLRDTGTRLYYRDLNCYASARSDKLGIGLFIRPRGSEVPHTASNPHSLFGGREAPLATFTVSAECGGLGSVENQDSPLRLGVIQAFDG